MTGILIDKSYDLAINPVYDEAGKILSGFTIGNIDYQRVLIITESQKGDIKEYPTMGFGIERYLRSNIDKRQQFIKELTTELKTDGFRKPKVTVGNELLDFTVEV